MRSLPKLVALLPVFFAGCAAVDSPSPARYLDVRCLDQDRPCEQFYAIVFSSETGPLQVKYTHSWLTVIRVQDRGPAAPPAIEHHTISWMPATLELSPLRLRAEPGVNLGLHDTIYQVALANDERIAMWGPYACRPSLFTRAVMQKQFLESGRMQYQCVDLVGEAARTAAACNCIHAITDMDPDRESRPLTLYGFAAGRDITRRLRESGLLLSPECTHDFLIPALRLDRFPITRPNDS